MAKHNEAGTRAERQALEYLAKQGLTLISQNFSCRGGEIDLIMQHKHILVFVEVRFRQSAAFGGALSSITKGKQNKIAVAAQNFLMENSQWANAPCRFDVIAITGTHIDWIENAFIPGE